MKGDDVLLRLKGGYIDGLSIGYRPVKWEMERSDEAMWGEIRHLKEVELREVSVVIWPMNESARVDLSSVKSLLAQESLSEEEREELKRLHAQITRALQKGSAPADSPGGLAPEDPQRLLMEEQLRALTLRGLGARV